MNSFIQLFFDIFPTYNVVVIFEWRNCLAITYGEKFFFKCVFFLKDTPTGLKPCEGE